MPSVRWLRSTIGALINSAGACRPVRRSIPPYLTVSPLFSTFPASEDVSDSVELAAASVYI